MGRTSRPGVGAGLQQAPPPPTTLHSPTMVAWSLKKKEAEKKEVAAALPLYKRLTKKQILLGLLVLQLLLSLVAVVIWYVVYQLELLPAGVHATFHTPATTLLISQKMGSGGEVEMV